MGSLYEADCNYAPRVEVHSLALGAGPLNDSTANGVVALTGGTAERPLASSARRCPCAVVLALTAIAVTRRKQQILLLGCALVLQDLDNGMLGLEFDAFEPLTGLESDAQDVALAKGFAA